MDSVWVFNPTIHDVTLQYGGRWFFFPKQKAVEVKSWVSKSPNEFMRNVSAMGDGRQDDPNAMYEVNIPAKKMVDEMMKRHQSDYYQRGFIVADKEPDEVDKELAIEQAKEWGRQLCDAFFQERRERQLTGYGRHVPDKIELDWIKYLGYDDQILNPGKPDKSALDATTIKELSVNIGKEIAQALREPVTARK